MQVERRNHAVTVVTASKDRKEITKMVASRRPFFVREGNHFSVVMPIADKSVASAQKTLEDLLDVMAGIKGLIEAEKEGTHSWDDLKAELGL